MRPPARLALLLVVAACKGEPEKAVTPTPAAPAPSAPSAPAGSAPAAPHAASGAAPDWGEPDMAKVEQLFKARHADVKRCYEAELQKHPESRGKLTLKFTIVESGALRYVSVPRTTFKRRDVPGCVQEVVRRWRTPFHPAEPVDVEYPLSFSPR